LRTIDIRKVQLIRSQPWDRDGKQDRDRDTGSRRRGVSRRQRPDRNATGWWNGLAGVDESGRRWRDGDAGERPDGRRWRRRDRDPVGVDERAPDDDSGPAVRRGRDSESRRRVRQRGARDPEPNATGHRGRHGDSRLAHGEQPQRRDDDHGSAAHKVDGVSTTNRYRNHDLYERCKFKSPEGSYIATPDEKFELVGTTYAGTHYQADGGERFNGDERAVARAIVDDWNESATYGERLLTRGPTRMGIGVEVTSTGKAYATVDVCA